MKKIEEPSVHDGGHGETVTTHPAFGQIGAARVSGHVSLYGSDFKHNGFMAIRISRSELHRNLNRDWHFSDGEIIEVYLSEAQWATFVSSPNIGSGVPCTIQRVEGNAMPGLPDPVSRVDQFSDEMKKKLGGTFQRVESVRDRLDEMGLPKGKTAEVRSLLEGLLTELRANLPFVAEQFGEHMEETVEKAKAEVHGYMVGVIQRAGLDALNGGALPIQIEQADDGAGEGA